MRVTSQILVICREHAAVALHGSLAVLGWALPPDAPSVLCRRHLPRMLLLHGTEDNSVPCEIAVEFGGCLKVQPCAISSPHLINSQS